MKVTYYIARRLRLGEEGRNSTSVVIAICGVALSVAVMMLSIAVVSGFKSQIRGKVAGFESQVTINATRIDSDTTASGDFDYLTFGPELKTLIDGSGLFSTYDLTIRQPSIIKTDNDFEGIVLYGIANNSKRAQFLKDNIADEELDGLKDNEIALSSHTARALSLNKGDKVFAYFFVDGTVKARRFVVAAIYNTNFSDYDKLYAFVPLQTLQKLNGLAENQGTQVDLTCVDGEQIDDSALELQRIMMTASYSGELAGIYQLSTVTQNAMLYLNWLDLLDTNVVVILILMALVSGFTLISSLFIIILERVQTIGLLKAMGASDRQIREVFTAIGWRLVLWGMLAGNVVSLVLIGIQALFHVVPLDPESYYLSFVPVRIDVVDILLLNAAVFVVSWAMLLVPARSVAKVSPARALRYE